MSVPSEEEGWSLLQGVQVKNKRSNVRFESRVFLLIDNEQMLKDERDSNRTESDAPPDADTNSKSPAAALLMSRAPEGKMIVVTSHGPQQWRVRGKLPGKAVRLPASLVHAADCCHAGNCQRTLGSAGDDLYRRLPTTSDTDHTRDNAVPAHSKAQACDAMGTTLGTENIFTTASVTFTLPNPSV